MASSRGNRRSKHHVTIDVGPGDVVILWVALVVVLVFGAFGLSLLLNWMLDGF